VLWSGVLDRPSVPAVPTIRAEDRQFAMRLANVLRELRGAAGWTQEKAAEEVGTSVSSLSRWETGKFAPKGYDLGRLFRAYERFGAEREWFFDPPEVVVRNPIRDRLAELARGATDEARADLAAERARSRASASRPVARRNRRPA
jgi:transcriptional regulator with XRE-family HTH domain